MVRNLGILQKPKPFFERNPSVLIFLAALSFVTLVATLLSEGFGLGIISTSFIKILGKTLCFCLIAIAMDLVWGYCGILSLGHFAFFGLGGYLMRSNRMNQKKDHPTYEVLNNLAQKNGYDWVFKNLFRISNYV